MKTVYETDWLASKPVFYNELTGRVGYNINDVIDINNLEFHHEGFNNYLDFGYSVFGQTPIEHVKFLRHSSRLSVDEQGRLSIEYLDDPVEQWLDYRLSEDNVIDLIKERVQQWEQSVEGEIIIPTSGGYDSRLLNWCIENKSRIRSFTYGVSDIQAESSEVVYARRLSEILETRWEQIPLGDYHIYLNEWDKIFGVSTHAHGMYHFEFYQKILPKVEGENPFLSGIIGDAWAGSVNIPLLENINDVQRLGYTHGLHVNSIQSNFSVGSTLLSTYWEAHRCRFDDTRFRVIEAMRFKIILLSYLRSVPSQFGFLWWSPFLDVDLCMAMLNLPPNRRRNRLWQKEFFQKSGLDLESMNLQVTHQNTLDLQALHRIPLKPLDMNILREVVRPDYVDWINQNIISCQSNQKEKILGRLLRIRKVGGALRKLGFADGKGKNREAYNAYCVLLPIENLLRKRNIT